MMENYYKILQVDSGACHEVIVAAYRRLAQLHHPDLQRGKSGDLMRRLNEAREWLLNARKRAELDRWLSGGSNEAPLRESPRNEPVREPPQKEPDQNLFWRWGSGYIPAIRGLFVADDKCPDVYTLGKPPRSPDGYNPEYYSSYLLFSHGQAWHYIVLKTKPFADLYRETLFKRFNADILIGRAPLIQLSHGRLSWVEDRLIDGMKSLKEFDGHRWVEKKYDINNQLEFVGHYYRPNRIELERVASENLAVTYHRINIDWSRFSLQMDDWED